MSAFEINVNIKAPEIVTVLERLIAALAKEKVVSVPAPVITAPVNPQPITPAAAPAATIPQPVPTTPVAPVTPPAPPVASVNPPVPQPAAPIAQPPAFTYDDLARAASSLMDAGKQQQLIALLGQFKVQALTQLPKEQYGAFATALRQMGARI